MLLVHALLLVTAEILIDKMQCHDLSTTWPAFQTSCWT
ncbi:hypothetical protein STXM2123_6006 [Streptomyces sp. F-3]|nr:hypothetical protein STXM2123_6006 [Streptomyces sp. F-3]